MRMVALVLGDRIEDQAMVICKACLYEVFRRGQSVHDDLDRSNC